MFNSSAYLLLLHVHVNTINFYLSIFLSRLLGILLKYKINGHLLGLDESN